MSYPTPTFASAPAPGCFMCGPVRNCEPYLDTVINNMKQMGATLFNNQYLIVLVYDDSIDNTLQKLKDIQASIPDKLIFYVNDRANRTKYRTWNIAYARNICLKQIELQRTTHPETYANYTFMTMWDMDEVNARPMNLQTLKHYLDPRFNDDWDALSFQTTPFYYDIWALSIYPYCFSYNHFHKNAHFYNIIKDYITKRLKYIQETDSDKGLLPCISAFNGFAIYRLDKIKDCKYDGRVNPDLIPKPMMDAHKQATGSSLMFPVYHAANVDCRAEDCEHRAFHVEAFKRNGAKIRISPRTLFIGSPSVVIKTRSFPTTSAKQRQPRLPPATNKKMNTIQFILPFMSNSAHVLPSIPSHPQQ